MFASRGFKVVFQRCSLKRIFSSTRASKSNLRPFSQRQHKKATARKSSYLSAALSLSCCPLLLPTLCPPDQRWLSFAQLDLPLLASGSRQHRGSWARKPQRGHPKPTDVSGKTPTDFREGCIRPRLKQSHLAFKTFT